MIRYDDIRWAEIENSFLVFVIVVCDLKLSKTLEQKLVYPVDVFALLAQYRKQMCPPSGVNLL